MTGQIFLNYRRGDDAGTVGRLFDRLEQTFGADKIFMDVEGHIRAGDDYVDVLRAQVAACAVLLAVIGPRWLTVADETGRRRLDNPEDWVRVEIASALEAGAKKRVIPVLVPGGEMPRAEDLPPDLAALARKQAVRITLERFRSDTQGLISQVRGVLADLESARAADAAQRVQVEAAQRQRAQDEAARQAAIEASAHEQRAAGMSPEDVRKAEELANWDFIKGRTDIDDLRDHLARFAGGVTERYAQARLAELTWAGLGAGSPVEQLRAFVDAFPQSEHASKAWSWIAEAERRAAQEKAEADRRAQETADWADVAASNDRKTIEAFLWAWPAGAHAADAKARLKELRGGGFSRRAVLKGVGLGIGGTLAAGVATQSTLVPGMPIWRLLHDQSVRTFTGHSGSVNSVAFAPDGRSVISGSSDTTLKLWDVATGKELRTFAGHSGSVSSVAFVADGRTAVSGSWDQTLKLWEVATGQELRTFSGHTDMVNAVAVAPDGRTMLSGSSVNTLELSADGRSLELGRGDNALKLWEIATGKQLRFFAQPFSPITSVAFAPDGRTAVSSDGQGIIALWEVATGKWLRSFVHPGSLNSVAFQANGQAVVSGGGDATLKLWDVGSGRELRTFVGHSGSVSSVALAPSGRTAISGSGGDESLKLWDVTAGGQLRSFTGHVGPVYCVAFAPDDRSVISGSYDNTLKLWDVAAWQA